MEAFSLLRYWRSTNGGDTTTIADLRTSTATTIVTAVTSQSSETEDDNDHGPFFDLEFTLPPEEDEHEEEKAGENELVRTGETVNSIDYCNEDDDGSDESELNFTLLSGSSGESTADVNVSVSPSDELFFNGGYVPVEQTVEVCSKPLKLQPKSLSLMKSATKFRVMMLKFNKLKSKSNAESSETTESNASNCSNFEVEDSVKSPAVDVPIVSLFKRRNSSKTQKKRQNDDASVSISSDEKKFTKEAMQRYLRKVKPLYVRVSKRYAEKLKLNLAPSPLPATEEQEHSPSPAPAADPKGEKETKSEVTEPPLLGSNIKAFKQGNLPAGLRVVCKHLRKSRSAFTAVAAAPPGGISSNRRDDSLLQQQDGIQSAILHCKRSFKASRDSDCSSSSGSDPVAPEGKCESGCDGGDGGKGEEVMKRREMGMDFDDDCDRN